MSEIDQQQLYRDLEGGQSDIEDGENKKKGSQLDVYNKSVKSSKSNKSPKKVKIKGSPSSSPN